MKINIPQLHFSKIMCAIVEFELISNGDKILIGLSGGKDSLFLTYALAVMQKRIKKSFSLEAVTIDPMFSEEYDYTPVDKKNTLSFSENHYNALTDFCHSLDIPHTVHKVNIASAIKAQKNSDPCFTCAFLRRGAINHFALRHGCNKVAYAHHHDDAVETFLMSLFFSGQLQTFLPKTFLSKTGITVIRPLVYIREKEIIDSLGIIPCSPLPSSCPFNGRTARQKTKNIIDNLSKENPLLYDHLSSAMRENSVKSLWPKIKHRSEMQRAYFSYNSATASSATSDDGNLIER